MECKSYQTGYIKMVINWMIRYKLDMQLFYVPQLLNRTSLKELPREAFVTRRYVAELVYYTS